MRGGNMKTKQAENSTLWTKKGGSVGGFEEDANLGAFLCRTWLSLSFGIKLFLKDINI